MESKKCSACGKEFECCATGTGCWCQQLTIPTENLQRLKENYADCLCKECLSKYAELPSNTSSPK